MRWVRLTRLAFLFGVWVTFWLRKVSRKLHRRILRGRFFGTYLVKYCSWSYLFLNVNFCTLCNFVFPSIVFRSLIFFKLLFLWFFLLIFHDRFFRHVKYEIVLFIMLLVDFPFWPFLQSVTENCKILQFCNSAFALKRPVSLVGCGFVLSIKLQKKFLKTPQAWWD